MSQQDRDTIAQKVNDVVTATAEGEDVPPAIVANVAWLLERALCDLNRIADVLEAKAPQP
jgi:hypothetical protein